MRLTGVGGHVAPYMAGALGPQIQGHHQAMLFQRLVQALKDATRPTHNRACVE